MIIRILLLFVLTLNLHAAEDSWYKKLNPKIEAGIFLPAVSGDITNANSQSSFDSEFDLSSSRASYFSLSLKPEKKYIPNLMISYFNMQEDTTSSLSSDIVVADRAYDTNTSLYTSVTYNSFNMYVYESLTLKGKVLPIFGKKIYTGDLAFDVGVDVKYLDWQYKIDDKDQDPAWIKIKEFVALPYLGMKYYRYDLIIYADVAALSLAESDATHASFGIDYRVVEGLFLSLGYIYEDFEIVEDNDTVYFKTSGGKFSFKYAF
jgi:hypothetical protein